MLVWGPQFGFALWLVDKVKNFGLERTEFTDYELFPIP